VNLNVKSLKQRRRHKFKWYHTEISGHFHHFRNNRSLKNVNKLQNSVATWTFIRFIQFRAFTEWPIHNLFFLILYSTVFFCIRETTIKITIIMSRTRVTYWLGENAIRWTSLVCMLVITGMPTPTLQSCTATCPLSVASARIWSTPGCHATHVGEDEMNVFSAK